MKKDFINVWHTIAAAMMVKGITKGYVLEESSPTGRVTKRTVLSEAERKSMGTPDDPHCTITEMSLEFAKKHIASNFDWVVVDGQRIALDRPLSDCVPEYSIDEVIEIEESIWANYPPSIAKYICNILNPSIKECSVSLLESSETFEFTLYHRHKKIFGYITRERIWNGGVEIRVEFDDDLNLSGEEKNDIVNHLKSKI